MVEDRLSLREMLADFLGQHGFEVVAAGSIAEGLEKYRSDEWHLVLLDLRLPDGSGLDFLQAVRKHSVSQPVVLMTAYGTIVDTVQAMKLGAVDFLQKPLDLASLLEVVRRAVEGARLQSEPLLFEEAFSQGRQLPLLVGHGERIRETAVLVQKIAPTDATVLFSGESGTGKELFARAVHLLSPRRNEPFVEVNCAAIPETLLENEFFGHAKGAYTGADSAARGKLELADGGTLFLDEIGEIPPSMQVKLLKAIEEKRFTPIGGSSPVAVDVRIVAATNRDLEAGVRSGSFREDLYFRLAQFPLRIPPLRERREDIVPLARHFVREAALRKGREVPVLAEAVQALLEAHPWPGNIRELKNAMERSVIMCERNVITVGDVFPAADYSQGRGIPLEELREKGLERCLRECSERLEGETMDRVLALTGGDRAAAADLLGLTADGLAVRLAALRERGKKP